MSQVVDTSIAEDASQKPLDTQTDEGTDLNQNEKSKVDKPKYIADPSKPKKSDNKFDLNDENFDYVILGTGLTESVIGASLALHGKKCLFLDKADKYGGTITNFNLE